MRLGTGLFTCQRRPDDDRSMASIYDEMTHLAGVADDAGLDSVWVSEHHFEPDGYLSATMPSLAAIAQATEDIGLGTCVALGPLYDPVRLAEDAATVDLLSGGRLTLGLALGSNPAEFGQFGVASDERVDRLEEAMAVCRGAWSEGPLGVDPEYHPVSPDVSVSPKPDGDIPILLGGAAKPAVRRAARTAEAWCSPSKLSVDGVATRVADARSVRAEAGVEDDLEVHVLRHGFVADSRAEAWEAMREGYFYLQRRYAEIFGDEPVQTLSTERRRELKDHAVFGTPEQVADELLAYRDAVGDDVHVILRTYFPGAGRERMAECVRLLGQEVRPKLE